MTTRPSRAMIMAAGLGTRMRPLTNDRPKPLVTVDGRTLLDHAIDRLKAVGVRTFVVNVHYKGEMVIDHLKGRSDATFIIQDERDLILDTGGALKRALPHFGEEPFFTHNSDSIWLESWGSNLERMVQRWDDQRMDCLMLLAATHTSLGYDGAGDFTMDAEGRLARRQAPRLAPFAWPGCRSSIRGWWRAVRLRMSFPRTGSGTFRSRRGACSASGLTGSGCISGHQRRARKPKRCWPCAMQRPEAR